MIILSLLFMSCLIFFASELKEAKTRRTNATQLYINRPISLYEDTDVNVIITILVIFSQISHSV